MSHGTGTAEGTLRAENLNLTDLLNRYGERFAIPENQRGYVWDMQEFRTLLLDLEENLRMGRDSFLGTVCLSEDGNGSRLIVDGQQRITTFSLLADILQKHLEDQAVCIPSFIESRIFSGPKDRTKNPTWLSYKKLMDVLEELLQDKRAFLDYLLDCVWFTVLHVPQETQHRIFDSINSAGKPLEIQELVYNDLYKMAETDDDKNALEDAWAKFLDVMHRTETAALALSTRTEDIIGETEEDEECLLEGPEYEEAPQEPAAGPEAGDAAQGVCAKQLSFRHFFTAFSRMNCDRRHSNDLYRAVRQRLDELPENDGGPGVAQARYLVRCARYYALLVDPLGALRDYPHQGRDPFEELFPCAGKAFIQAVVRFSTLHLGDALPVLLRLAMENTAPGGEELKAKQLTVYLDSIFWTWLLARVTHNRKLQACIRRRLPGLERETAAFITEQRASFAAGTTLGDIIQTTLIGSFGDLYGQSCGGLRADISRLSYQGNAAQITSLLAAEALKDDPAMSRERLLEWLARIHARGGFSVEHIVPQSDEGETPCDIQQLGNLALLEKNLNSEANAWDIHFKSGVYADSVFRGLDDAAKALYGKDLQELRAERNVPPRPTKELVGRRTEKLAGTLANMLAEQFAATKPAVKEEKSRLVYLEESLDGRRTWTWKWEKPNAGEDPVKYYDDGGSSKRTRETKAIRHVRIGGGTSPKEKISISGCSEYLINGLWEALKSKVSPEEYGEMLIKAVESVDSVEVKDGKQKEKGRKAKNSGYISRNPIKTNRRRDSEKAETEKKGTCFTFSRGDCDESPVSVTLYLTSEGGDYPGFISRFFNIFLEKLKISETEQEELPPFCLEYAERDFRDSNGAVSPQYAYLKSRFAYVCGSPDKYRELLREEIQGVRAAGKTAGRAVRGKRPDAGQPFVSGEIMTLEEICGRFGDISVPMYQRRYVWTRDNWERLVRSIREIPDGESGFFGILLLGEKTGKGGEQTWELIDGQQRLTTLSYLFSDLRLKDRIHFEDIQTRRAFENDGDDASVYKHLKDYADDSRFEEETWREKAGRLRFLVLKLNRENSGRAGELFAAVNGRGKRLTPGEIIKNYILMKMSGAAGFPLDDARAMWADSGEFERFIKAYTDMKKGELISRGNLPDAVREIYETGVGFDFSWFIEAISGIREELDSGEDRSYSGFLTAVAKMAEGGDAAAIQTLRDIGFGGVGDQSFFMEMPRYWQYYKCLTEESAGGTRSGNSAKWEKEKEDFGGEFCAERYLHHLTGTRTTLPPLLYHFALWQKETGEKRAERKAAFLTILRHLTDAFLLCHLCGYDNALKSMDRRMAKLCREIDGDGVEQLLSIAAVFGMRGAQPDRLRGKLDWGLGQDLYHKRQSLALLLLWRCEQSYYAGIGGNPDESAFYQRVCSHMVDQPSVEHIHPQAEKDLWAETPGNYALLEEALNSKAKDRDFAVKKMIYGESGYQMTKALHKSEIARFEKETCDVWRGELYGRLIGKIGSRGLCYVGKDAENQPDIQR